MAKKGEEKPKVVFEKISKELADIEHKQHIDQIAPSVTDVFIKHSKYKDKNGVIHFKTKFNRKEAEKLADDLYDTLGYHSHRRVFGIGEKEYNNLLKYKDANGNAYIDGITQVHFQIDRRSLKKTLARDDDENEIDASELEELLKKPISGHAKQLTAGVISKYGIDDPKHMASIKRALEGIVKKYHIGKKQLDLTKLHTSDELLGAYVGLSQQHYKKGMH